MVAGGLERVTAELANYFATEKGFRVNIITLTSESSFYRLDSKVSLIRPDPEVTNSWPRFLYLARHIRSSIQKAEPQFVLSFGSIFNSLVLLATMRMTIPTFVSDRSNPYRNSTFNIFKDYKVKHDGLLHIVLEMDSIPSGDRHHRSN